MKTNSILLTTILVISFFFILIMKTKAQSTKSNNSNCIAIQYNEDNFIKRIEASFTNNLTLDSLVRIKNELQVYGFTINYKQLKFDNNSKLLGIDCKVNFNNGNMGSFGTDSIHKIKKRFGFYRDYSKDAYSSFGTGVIDKQ